MDNILLGKIVKAMYKLSGKTLQQISDETELTIDTLNNLFYARLLKPGFFGVSAVVKSCGYTIEDLDEFLVIASALPETADITEEFAKYIIAKKDTKENPVSTSATADSTKEEKIYKNEDEIKVIKEAHETEISRCREQISDMKESFKIAEENHKAEIKRMSSLTHSVIIGAALIVIAALIVVAVLK